MYTRVPVSIRHKQVYICTAKLYDSDMTTTGKIEFETWYAEISDEERAEVEGGGDWDKLHAETRQAWNRFARSINVQEQDSGV